MSPATGVAVGAVASMCVLVRRRLMDSYHFHESSVTSMYGLKASLHDNGTNPGFLNELSICFHDVFMMTMY
jgi:hypothetical protein